MLTFKRLASQLSSQSCLVIFRPITGVCNVFDGRFQADLLLLSSSEPLNLIYVETAELDGWVFKDGARFSTVEVRDTDSTDDANQNQTDQ